MKAQKQIFSLITILFGLLAMASLNFNFNGSKCCQQALILEIWLFLFVLSQIIISVVVIALCFVPKKYFLILIVTLGLNLLLFVSGFLLIIDPGHGKCRLNCLDLYDTCKLTLLFESIYLVSLGALTLFKC